MTAFIRFEPSISEEVASRLRLLIERATCGCSTACDVFVYPVSPARSVMVRLTVGDAVLPLLLYDHDQEPDRIVAAFKGALATARY